MQPIQPIQPLVDALNEAFDREIVTPKKRIEPRGRNPFEFAILLDSAFKPPTRPSSQSAAVVEFATTLSGWKAELGYTLREVASSDASAAKSAVCGLLNLLNENEVLDRLVWSSFVGSVPPCLAFMAARHFPRESLSVFTIVNTRLSNALRTLQNSSGSVDVDVLNQPFVDLDVPRVVTASIPISVAILADEDKTSLSTLASITKAVKTSGGLLDLSNALMASVRLDGVDATHLLLPCSPVPIPTQQYRAFTKAIRKLCVFFSCKPEIESYALATVSVCSTMLIPDTEFEALELSCFVCRAFEPPPSSSCPHGSAVVVVNACLDGVEGGNSQLFEVVHSIIRKFDPRPSEALRRVCFLFANSRATVGVCASLQAVPLESSASIVELYARSPSGLMLPSLCTEAAVEGLVSLVRRQLESKSTSLFSAARRFVGIEPSLVAPAWKDNLLTLELVLNEQLDRRVAPLPARVVSNVGRFRASVRSAVRDALYARTSAGGKRVAALVLWIKCEDDTRLFARRFKTIFNIDVSVSASDFEDELRIACRLGRKDDDYDDDDEAELNATEDEDGRHRLNHAPFDARTRDTLAMVKRDHRGYFTCTKLEAPTAGRPFCSIVFWTESE